MRTHAHRHTRTRAHARTHARARTRARARRGGRAGGCAPAPDGVALTRAAAEHVRDADDDEQRTYAAASDPRALHASCGGTGEKWVLAKFLRAAPLSAGDRAEL